MNIDRTKASRLLAKCCAYVECGKPETARTYALELMCYLGECIDGDVAAMTEHVRAVNGTNSAAAQGAGQ